MVKHVDVKGREYSPAPPGDTLCRTCVNKNKDCTWPGRRIVLCMEYDKEDPGQSEIQGPRSPEELLRLSQERKKRDSIMEDSIR